MTRLLSVAVPPDQLQNPLGHATMRSPSTAYVPHTCRAHPRLLPLSYFHHLLRQLQRDSNLSAGLKHVRRRHLKPSGLAVPSGATPFEATTASAAEEAKRPRPKPRHRRQKQHLARKKQSRPRNFFRSLQLFDGADERIRTADLRITSALLYQLSHIGITFL